jgi:moderate conductance mechanosensitive channel
MESFIHELIRRINDINWVNIGIAGIKIILYFIIGRIIINLGSKFIDRIFKHQGVAKISINERRANTLSSLLKSVITYAVYFFVIIYIITDQDIFNKEANAILAGAGVVGLAISFGAQSLVKDIITGFFIIFEDQYAVGDYINTAGVSGFVEDIGLRITKLRDWGGEVHIVPNGQITQVTNLSRGAMRAQVDIMIAYEEDVDKAIKIMEDVCEKITELHKEVIVEAPKVLGINSITAAEVVIRVVAKTLPMEQWNFERELRKMIKVAFDEAGIETSKRVLLSPKGV